MEFISEKDDIDITPRRSFSSLVSELTLSDSDIRDGFRLFDKNGDGFITSDEISSLLQTLQVDVPKGTIPQIFSRYDTDGNGLIDFDEFQEMLHNATKAKRTDIEKMFERAFRIFDEDGDGFITQSELKATIFKLGMEATDEEIEDIFQRIGKSGKISFSDFRNILVSDADEIDEEISSLKDDMLSGLTSPKVFEGIDKREAFELFDENKDGFISTDEVQRVYTHLGQEINERTASEIVHKFDADGNGVLDYHEFCSMLETCQSEENVERSMKAAFRFLDVEQKGYIGAEVFKSWVQKLDKTGISDGDLENMMTNLGLPKDGEITFELFRAILQS